MLTRDYLESRAEMIMRQCVYKSKTVAVFITNGTVRSCNAGGELYGVAMNRALGRLVGVYDQRASSDWIYEDLQYMADRIAGEPDFERLARP